jgi:hypothetical protein
MIVADLAVDQGANRQGVDGSSDAQPSSVQGIAQVLYVLSIVARRNRNMGNVWGVQPKKWRQRTAVELIVK